VQAIKLEMRSLRHLGIAARSQFVEAFSLSGRGVGTQLKQFRGTQQSAPHPEISEATGQVPGLAEVETYLHFLHFLLDKSDQPGCR
jgi:hypothetical protein